MRDGGEVVALPPAFASGTTTYTAVVDHDVSAATVTVTVVSAGSAYEIRLNGVVDQDGVVPLAVGAGNVISGGRDGAGRGERRRRILRDGDAGRVFGGEFEWAFALGGWREGLCAVPCLRGRDDGLHGDS